MDSRLVLSVLAFLVALVLGTGAMSIPSEDKDRDMNEIEPDNGLTDRATWLETRDVEEEFKGLVYLAIHELVQEGKLDSSVLTKSSYEKRGRWQGFCFRRTRSGRFLPYICWKGEGKPGARK